MVVGAVGMVIMASPRADSISSPKETAEQAFSKGKPASTKKKAVGSPNLHPPPKYEMPEDWPAEGPIDLNQVRARGLMASRPPTSFAWTHLARLLATPPARSLAWGICRREQ